MDNGFKYAMLLANSSGVGELVSLTVTITLGTLGQEADFRVEPDRGDDVDHAAQQGAQEAYRILWREGYTRRKVTFRYELHNPPRHIPGLSGELAFALSGAVAHQQLEVAPFAATGRVLEGGAVGFVDSVPVKLSAAIEKLPSGGRIFFPMSNCDEVDSDLRRLAEERGITLQPVSRLDEAFDLLGIGIQGIYLESPYRGLEAFEYEHRGIFYGRQAEIEEIRKKLIQRAAIGKPGILLIGASGSGKTSLVQAGLLPILARGPEALTDKPLEWSIWRPREALKYGSDISAILRSMSDNWRALTGLSVFELGQTPEIAISRIQSGLPANRRIVWVIDQLEELFSLPFYDEAVDDFGRILLALQSAGAWVIGTLRSDYYASYQENPSLFECFGENAGRQDIVTLKDTALEQIIVGPAEAAELSFEINERGESLAALLRDEASGAHDPLPLLEFTLSELFRLRKKETKQMTFEAYRQIGGLAGAIGVRAESAVESLQGYLDKPLSKILRNLVVVRDGKVGARRARLSNFPQGSPARALIDQLQAYRLVVAENIETDSKDRFVRVAHEALLTDWKRAKNSINEMQEELELRDWLEIEASRWQSREDLIVRRKRLKDARDLLRKWGPDLGIVITDYVAASLKQKRLISTLQIGFTAGMLCIAFFIARFAIDAQSKGLKEKQQRLTAESLDMLVDSKDPARAMVLALNALPGPYSKQGDWDIRAEEALFFSVMASSIRTVIPIDRQMSFFDYSSDGRLLVGFHDGVVSTWAMPDGKSHIIYDHQVEREVRYAGFCRATGQLLTALSDGYLREWDSGATTPSKIWNARLDITEVDPLRRFKRLETSPDGDYLALIFSDSIDIWSLETCLPISTSPAPDNTRDVSLSASRSGHLALLARNGDVIIRKIDAEATVAELHVEKTTKGILLDSHANLVFAKKKDSVDVWSVRGGNKIYTYEYDKKILSIDISGDDTALLVTTATGVYLHEIGELITQLRAAIDQLSQNEETHAGAPPEVFANMGRFPVVEERPIVFAKFDRDRQSIVIADDYGGLAIAEFGVFEERWGFLASSLKTIRTSIQWQNVDMGKVYAIGQSYDNEQVYVVNHTEIDIYSKRTSYTEQPLDTAINVQGRLFSKGGKRHLWIDSDNQQVKIYDIKTQKAGPPVDSLTESNILTISQDGRKIIALPSFDRLQVWRDDEDQMGILHEFSNGENIVDAAISPNSKLAYVIYGDGSAVVWDLEQDLELVTFSEDKGLCCAAFSPVDQNILYLASQDGSVVTWDVEEGNLHGAPLMFAFQPWSLKVSPGGKYLSVSGTSDVELWDLQKSTRSASVSDCEEMRLGGCNVSFDSAEELLSVRTEQGYSVHSTENGEVISGAGFPRGNEIVHTKISPNGRWVLSESTDKYLELFSIALDSVVYDIPISGALQDYYFSDNSQEIVVVEDEYLRVIKLPPTGFNLIDAATDALPNNWKCLMSKPNCTIQ